MVLVFCVVGVGVVGAGFGVGVVNKLDCLYCRNVVINIEFPLMRGKAVFSEIFIFTQLVVRKQYIYIKVILYSRILIEYSHNQHSSLSNSQLLKNTLCGQLQVPTRHRTLPSLLPHLQLPTPNSQLNSQLSTPNHSKTLSVDNCRPRLFILFLGDPHLLKSWKRTQNGATNPYRASTIERIGNLDFRGPRS